MLATNDEQIAFATRVAELLPKFGYKPANIQGQPIAETLCLDCIGIVRELTSHEKGHLLIDCGHQETDSVHIANVYFYGDYWNLEYFGVDFGRDVEVIEDFLARIFNVIVFTRQISGVPKYVH